MLGAHSVAGISFYSTVAVFTMSIVSTVRQVSSGKSLNWQIVGWVSSGAVVGGVVGNIVFEVFLQLFESPPPIPKKLAKKPRTTPHIRYQVHDVK